MRVLSRKEENDITNAIKAEARKKCHQEILDFARCSKDNFLAVVLNCREEHKNMHTCTHQYTSSKALDQAKLEYLKNGGLKKE